MTVHVDVAACIRWLGVAIAMAVVSFSLTGEQAVSVLHAALGHPWTYFSAPSASSAENPKGAASTATKVLRQAAGKESAS